MTSQQADPKTMTAEEIVRDELVAWGSNDIEKIMAHFADDATFDIGPAWPKLTGSAAIREMMTTFFAGGKCVNLEILYIAVDKDVVLMERRDYWVVDGKQMSWPVMGAYEVQDGKITAWREYFYPPTEA